MSGPYALRKKTYSPPAAGNRQPNSAYSQRPHEREHAGHQPREQDIERGARLLSHHRRFQEYAGADDGPDHDREGLFETQPPEQMDVCHVFIIRGGRAGDRTISRPVCRRNLLDTGQPVLIEVNTGSIFACMKCQPGDKRFASNALCRGRLAESLSKW